MSQAVVITGMHRSGTSLVTNLLQRAGIHVGESLLGGNSANPRGYFEDLDFYEFQEQLLHHRGQTYLYVKDDFAFEPTATELDRARQLVAARSQRPLWGWKDPRTSLFLPFWFQLLPEARFVFVYRHPIEVLLSLVRRGEFDRHPAPMKGLRAWLIYNTSIRTFYEQHGAHCVLAHIDGITANPQQFAHLVQEKLQIDCDLSPAAFDEIFHREELQKVPLAPELDDLLMRLYPELVEQYQWLNSAANLAAPELPSHATATQKLSPLVPLTQDLTGPLSLPVRYSLLQMLLSLVAPEHVERMLVQFSENAQAAQQTIDYVWMQVQQTKRIIAEQEQELACRADQITRQQQELEQQAERIEALCAELESIYGTRIGKVARTYVNLKERWKHVA